MARRNTGRRGATSRTKKLVWAFLCRAGGESDLISELEPWAPARRRADGLVVTERGLQLDAGRGLAFARQAMRTTGEVHNADPHMVARSMQAAMTAALGPTKTCPWTLQVRAPDAKGRNARSSAARALDEELGEALDECLSEDWIEAFVDDPEDADRLAQVWMVEPDSVILGFTPVADALALDPAPETEARGRRRPRKLAESWVTWDLKPTKGETVVVLESGDPEWAEATLELGARVLSVGTGREEGRPHRRMLSIDASPFEYYPEDTVDWLLVDLSRRPIETMKLAAKWARRGWASQLVLSLKLPMKDKAAFLRDAEAALSEAGWRGLRPKQLFSDRDELMVFAFLDPKLVQRGWQPPFGFDRKLRNKDRGSSPSSSKGTRDKARSGQAPRSEGRKTGRGKRRSPLRNKPKSHKKPSR